LTASQEVDEGVQMLIPGNAGAEGARRHGVALRRRGWRRRSSEGAKARVRAGSRVLIGARVRVGGEFASPGRQCMAGRGPNRTAGEVAALAGRRGVVAASLGVQDACAHGEKPRGRTGGTGGLSRSTWPRTRSTGGVRAHGGGEERGKEAGTIL
jgi:hypothetical protein